MSHTPLGIGSWVLYVEKDGMMGHVARVLKIDREKIQARDVIGRKKSIHVSNVRGYWPKGAKNRSHEAMRPYVR